MALVATVTDHVSRSISIACWVVVFTPQIFENFRRSSADGLSLVFIIIWLLGDVFNILGAVLQGVLPTMIILAVYYTFADLALLLQCFYYRGFTLSDAPTASPSPVVAVEDVPDEERPLLSRIESPIRYTPEMADRGRRDSGNSFSSAFGNVDATRLSPATPMVPPPRPSEPRTGTTVKSRSFLYAFLFNTGSLVVVCAAGALGWWLSARAANSRHTRSPPSAFASGGPDDGGIKFNLWGQIFGYLCAALYLASRVPQLLLNFRRKSTEGVSMLFFLFACVGNLTYTLSILVYEPSCARIEGIAPGATRTSSSCLDGEWSREYWSYVLMNLSWLLGSAGTLALDGCIFVQFWMYRGRQATEGTEVGAETH